MTEVQAQSIEQRLANIEALLARLVDQQGIHLPPPEIDDNSDRLCALARRDPAAAIAESKRIAQKFMKSGRKKHEGIFT